MIWVDIGLLVFGLVSLFVGGFYFGRASVFRQMSREFDRSRLFAPVAERKTRRPEEPLGYPVHVRFVSGTPRAATHLARRAACLAAETGSIPVQRANGV